MELILLGDPLWISTFPWLKRRCMQLLAQRLSRPKSRRESWVGWAVFGFQAPQDSQDV